ncbi:MAG: VTT domain-containing protein [Saprospiraceae bacterium]|jgi:membrane-associated protein|nr:VTT domain-containing protein [Saprospiraceae bacterium]MBP9210492.1 VTT domain-containing protein [Saprospiraceae bacterium]MBV6472590.1 Protein DedA [Saprospiraceae bacterium]
MEVLQQAFDFVLNIEGHLVELIEQYGIYIYIILFLILFVETGLVIAPFLPGDSLLFAAGALAAGGNLDVFVLFAVCFAGAFLGNQLNFAIGSGFGKAIFDRERKFIKEEYLVRTQVFYDKHGGKALIIGRYLPFIRTFVPFVAGIGKMKPARFTYFNVLGGLLWVIPVIGVGYLFGNIPFVKQNFSIIVIAILFVSLFPMIWGFFAAMKHAKRV